MKNYRVILFLLLTTFSSVTYGDKLNLQDVINIAKANFGQIQDIEFTCSEKRFSVEPDKMSTEYIAQTSWHLEKNWVKQSSKILESGSEEIYISSHSWDGKHFKSKTELLGETDFQTRKEGRVSSKRSTLREDIFSAMGMKGNNCTYIDRLDAKYAQIEGVALVDGREVVVIRSSFFENQKDNDLLYMKYYVDIKRGGIPLKSELYSKGELSKTVKNVVITEVSDELYLPVKGEVYFKSKFDGKRRAIEYHINLKSIKINQGLTQEHFDVDFERNLPIWDENIGMGYYHKVGVLPEREVDKQFFDQLIKETKSTHVKTDITKEKSTSKVATVTTKDIVEKPDPEKGSHNFNFNKKPLWITVIIAFVFFIVIAILFTIKRKPKISE